MSIIEIFFISVGLAMDACAVSICKGLAMEKMDTKKAFIIACYFSIFQGIMPIIGFCLGINFQKSIVSIDHWIAFILLNLIGFNMIKEARNKKENSDEKNDNTNFKTMVVLAIATSIDALAIGITFAFLKSNILISALIIAIITFIISLIGVKIGNVFGCKYEKKAQIFGGVILSLLGCKILIDHIFF